MIDNNYIDVNQEQMNLVKSLILGEVKSDDTKKWIYQIVANKKNSIDVDKFDYICRDSYHLGIKSASVDYDTIFRTSLVINDELCFDIKVLII